MSKLERAVRELDAGVLVNQTIMKAAKGLVLLINDPVLSVELDFNHVVSVGSIVSLVLNHASVHYVDHEWNLEEDCALARAVFCARLDMVNKDLSREEYVAELALHRNSMLEDPLVDFHGAHLGLQLPVSFLHI